ncbi:hypothetical protein N7447_004937 [Penicillium robsamsonii]|uniref:uncharacterized protein n=1 Tax=Penicillium robsamsonii TaxID=1792511 RepID=UPI00254706F8|nr:uncharacterized protein N7447_004937 [Penicillium robsamsonii]KAJ5822597.1 hypothetical protein N7447_004937 [Penicillium robsamsonii]
MPGHEITKAHALRQIRKTLSALKTAAESCGTVIGATDLPQAFSVVAQRIPLSVDIFTSLDTYLDSVGEDKDNQELKDMYPVVKEVADACSHHIESLEVLFETVAQSDKNTQDKLTSYREAVQYNGGRLLEKVMLDLLRDTALVCVEPFATQEQIQELQAALQELQEISPSLKDALGAAVVMNHSGSGNQFYHGGKGHQNICSGGFQVTGDNHNAHYTYTEKTAERAKA